VGLLGQDEELAFEILVGGAGSGTAEEELADAGLARDGGLAEGLVDGRDGAPAEYLESFLLGEFDEDGFGLRTDRLVGGEVEHAHAVVTRLGQGRDAGRRTDLGEEGVRHLDQDAGAVAGVGLAAAGAAVVQVHQDGERLLDDVMRTLALHLADESDATGIVLELRIVKTLFRGESVMHHLVLVGKVAVKGLGAARAAWETSQVR
jgi:hypothetical protein